MESTQATWRWRSILVAVSLLWVLPLASSSLQAQSFNPAYDVWFQEYTLKYLYGLVPEDDWRWLKAQCFQESRLKPEALSPAGALGICQLMSGAAQDAGLTPPERLDPQKNIRAGAFILRRNIRTWFPRPTRFDRLQLGWAGYNAGAGKIIRSQAKCGGPTLWAGIAPCLYQITGPDNAHETITYVALIPKWYMGMQ